MRRTRVIAAVTLAGWVAGLATELLRDPTTEVKDALVAALFAPLTATLYGDTLFAEARTVGSILGFCFWPLWLALSVAWWRRPHWWWLVLLGCWCTLGFSQSILRLGILMSV